METTIEARVNELTATVNSLAQALEGMNEGMNSIAAYIEANAKKNEESKAPSVSQRMQAIMGAKGEENSGTNNLGWNNSEKGLNKYGFLRKQ